MKYFSIICVFVVICIDSVLCQEKKHYCFAIINSHVEQEDYDKAIIEINLKDSLTNNDLYNLAVCYSYTGDLNEAQNYLLSFIEISPYSFTPGIFLDYRLDGIRKSREWELVYNKLLDKFLSENGKVKDTVLSVNIMLHGILDQKYRGLIAAQPKFKGGVDFSENYVFENVDSINTVFLDSVVNSVGWPTYSLVGNISGDYMFYILQHSDRKHLKRYIPLLEEAVKQNEADKFLWAMAYDRLRRYSNKKQIYGTQYVSRIIDGKMQPHELQPTKNRRNVNKRRKDFGFETTVEEEIIKFNKMYGIE
jgi:tetratricopeptide (TPR) repeat protein